MYLQLFNLKKIHLLLIHPTLCNPLVGGPVDYKLHKTFVLNYQILNAHFILQ